MSATAYPKAVFLEPPTIFGVRLRPFSAGHRLLMEEYVDLEDRHPAQLAIAVLICSRTFREGCALLARPDIEKIGAEFADRIQWHRFGFLRWPKRVDWVAEWNKMAAYLEAASAMPPMDVMDRSRADRLSTHSVLSYRIITGHMYSWEEFLDHPWVLILWEAAALFERKGGCRILTPGEWEARDKQAAINEAIEKARENAGGAHE